MKIDLSKLEYGSDPLVEGEIIDLNDLNWVYHSILELEREGKLGMFAHMFYYHNLRGET